MLLERLNNRYNYCPVICCVSVMLIVLVFCFMLFNLSSFCILCQMFPVSLDCVFLISVTWLPLVFSKVYYIVCIYWVFHWYCISRFLTDLEDSENKNNTQFTTATICYTMVDNCVNQMFSNDLSRDKIVLTVDKRFSLNIMSGVAHHIGYIIDMFN